MKKALWLWIVIDAILPSIASSCSKPVWISLFC